MYLSDLQHKLKRLNSSLVILTDNQVRVGSSVPSYPLVLMFGKRTTFDSAGKHYMDAETQKFIEMKENGQRGEYVCGVSEYTPEYDCFELVAGSPGIKMRGWRSLVKLLVSKKICSLDRAKQVFSSSIGEYDYDKWTYEEKVKRFLDETRGLTHAF